VHDGGGNFGDEGNAINRMVGCSEVGGCADVRVAGFRQCSAGGMVN